MLYHLNRSKTTVDLERVCLSLGINWVEVTTRSNHKKRLAVTCCIQVRHGSRIPPFECFEKMKNKEVKKQKNVYYETIKREIQKKLIYECQ